MLDKWIGYTRVLWIINLEKTTLRWGAADSNWLGNYFNNLEGTTLMKVSVKMCILLIRLEVNVNST